MRNTEDGRGIFYKALRDIFSEAEIQKWSKVLSGRTKASEREHAEKQAAEEVVTRVESPREIEDAVLEVGKQTKEKKSGFCSCAGAGCATCGVLAVGACALVAVAGPEVARTVEAFFRTLQP